MRYHSTPDSSGGELDTTASHLPAISMAFQPIVHAPAQRIVSFEALVRGPGGESAGSVLAQVGAADRTRFDGLCRDAPREHQLFSQQPRTLGVGACSDSSGRGTLGPENVSARARSDRARSHIGSQCVRRVGARVPAGGSEDRD